MHGAVDRPIPTMTHVAHTGRASSSRRSQHENLDCQDVITCLHQTCHALSSVPPAQIRVRSVRTRRHRRGLGDVAGPRRAHRVRGLVCPVCTRHRPEALTWPEGRRTHHRPALTDRPVNQQRTSSGGRLDFFFLFFFFDGDHRSRGRAHPAYGVMRKWRRAHDRRPGTAHAPTMTSERFKDLSPPASFYRLRPQSQRRAWADTQRTRERPGQVRGARPLFQIRSRGLSGLATEKDSRHLDEGRRLRVRHLRPRRHPVASRGREAVSDLYRTTARETIVPARLRRPGRPPRP